MNKGKYLKEVMKNKEAIWSIFFKTNKPVFKNKRYKFNYQLETDGVACSILLIRKDLYNPNKKTHINHMKKPKSFRSIRYVDELSEKEKELYRDYEIVAIDPGKADLLYATNGKTEVIQKENGKTMKLHPVFDDEVAVFIPFTDLKDALSMLVKLGKRKIGLSLAVLSAKYLAECLSPTIQISKDFEDICKNYLKLNWVVSVIGTKDNQRIVEDMAEYTMDQALLKSLILGAPRFSASKESEFLKILSQEDDPLKALFTGPMRKHLEKSLDPSPEQIAKVYDPDLQDFFKKVYSRPEMTDVVWLHAFRRC